MPLNIANLRVAERAFNPNVAPHAPDGKRPDLDGSSHVRPSEVLRPAQGSRTTQEEWRDPDRDAVGEPLLEKRGVHGRPSLDQDGKPPLRCKSGENRSERHSTIVPSSEPPDRNSARLERMDSAAVIGRR